MVWMLFLGEWRLKKMRIIEINIDNFGKLNNFHMTFNKGINIIYGENESGKTTVFEFIRGMFFGFESEKGRSIATNRYKKYHPWTGAAIYKGSMRVEHKGCIYHIKRDFYKDSRSFSCVEELSGEKYSFEEFQKLDFMQNMDSVVFDNVIYTKILGDGVDVSLTPWLEKTFSEMEISFSDSIAYLDGERKRLKKKMDFEVYNSIMDSNKKLNYIRNSIRELEEEREKASNLSLTGDNKRKLGNWMYILLGILGIIACILGQWIIVAFVVVFSMAIYLFKRKQEVPLEKNTARDYDIATGRIFELKRYETALLKELEQLEAVQEENKRLELKVKGIDLAKKKLENISQRAKNDFTKGINPYFQKYMESFSAGKYMGAIVDDNLNVKVLLDGEYVETDYLSIGARKQANLALRYAISMGCRMTDVYMFDDAFVCFDDTRLQETFGVLAGNNMGQIFIATCTCREENILEKLDISYGICFMEENMENG